MIVFITDFHAKTELTGQDQYKYFKIDLNTRSIIL